MSKSITIPVTLDGAARKKDDSVSLRFVSTFEMTTEDYMEIDKARNQTGWLLFSANPLEVADIPAERAPEKEGKSQSKRLYNTLFVLWRQKHSDAPATDFDEWYKLRMEQIIDKVKNQLEDK